MKYWVYKESRILGPFDKEGVSGLPGLDSGTLVCEGDPSGGAWLPAGEIKDLGGFAASAIGGDLGEFPSTIGLLDQLQIDASGLIGDDDFSGSLAEDLFQDASFRKGFGDVLSEGGSSDNADAVRARQKAAELTIQLETMYKRIAELETSQADLMRRLGEKERELLQQETGIPADAGPAKTFLSPAPPPKAAPSASIPSTAPLTSTPGVPPGLEPAPAPSDWSETKGAGTPLPAIFDAPPPSKLVVPGVPGMPPAPDLPAMPSFAPPAALPPAPAFALPSEASVAPAAELPAPKTQSFGKPKSFKIVPTVKSFKVLGAADVAPVDANPAPVFSEPTPAPAPAAAVPPPPVIAPPVIPPPIIAPVQLAPAPVPAPIPAPLPEPVTPNPFAAPEPIIATPTPVAPPPNTLSRSQPQPVPDLGATVQASSNDLAGSADANLPPATLARGRGAAEAPADAGVAARFAKPEPAPATAAPKPPRSNKKFLIGGGILVILLAVVGVIFMRQPKDDLKQMTTLDDGKAPIGLGADDTATAPPMVKPKQAEPEAAPAPVAPPPPGPSAEHQAAIAAVKDFPLDGGRGTVGRWLQYSYTASPGAGTEEWNASTTGENNVLVEYRMVPGASGGKGALYLFEVNAIGLVMGKNLEAREMLAGGPPAEPVKPKKAKGPAKKAVKRRPVVEEPKEVPLLPLPDSGELRPPAEDDGTFGSDTINSGI